MIRKGDSDYELTTTGEQRLTKLGPDIAALRSQRRQFVRSCLDWTERRPHLAGALAAALAERLFELDWLERMPGTCALRVTAEGRQQLLGQFALAR